MNPMSYENINTSNAGAGETQAQGITQAQGNRRRRGNAGAGDSQAQTCSPRPPMSAAEVLDYLRHMEQRMVRTVGEPGMLGRWMETIFPREQVRYLWALYRVGALADGRTVFFYTSRQDHTVDGKVMAYGPDGHRVKACPHPYPEGVSGEGLEVRVKAGAANNPHPSPLTPNPSSPPLGGVGGGSPSGGVGGGSVTWLHALDRLERPLPLPLFGEHLADALPFAPLCLVESEKTALIAKLWRPDCTWLATGGKSLFTAERLRVLSGRTVLVWPDADAVGEWMDKAALLGPELGMHFRFPAAYLARIREGPPKADLADLIVATKTTQGNPCAKHG